MDDTNPTTESMDYVHAIERDVRWLGFEWGEHTLYASDYFERFYELGEHLIEKGRAYVCDLSEDEFSKSYRGTITEPGKESPYRARTVEENLDLFRRMKKGEFPDGAKVLRARIDMASPNMKMRDPPLVRIKHAHHYRTGDTWCIYPLYDYAHCLEDSFEGVTHSLCTLEFETARELYDWVIQATDVPHVPRQTEFAKLQFTYIMLSKRRLKQMVDQKIVDGWDDPRMPTLAGFRRRGFTPEAIRELCAKVGVAKNNSTVDIALLEHTAREDLDGRSARVMCVLRPLKVVIESFPENEVEEIDAPYWPLGTEPSPTDKGARTGSRKLPFSRVVWIERDDFSLDPPKGYYRLAPGREVRLRHAYIVTCTDVVKDDKGEVALVRCTHDPSTRGGVAPAGKRIEGTIHWVSAAHAKDLEVRLYDRLFAVENPGADESRDFTTEINPKSLEVLRAKAEPSLAAAVEGDRFQFERLGYFIGDRDSKPGAPVFNRTLPLKDSWTKVVAKAEAPTRKLATSQSAEAVRRAEVARAEAPTRKLSTMPALSPEAKALSDLYGLGADEARVLAQEPPVRALFDEAVSAPDGKAHAKTVAQVLANDLLGELRTRKLERAPFDGGAIVELVTLVDDGTISSKQAKDVLAEMYASGARARAIVEAKGLRQIASEGALAPVVDEVLSENADAVARFKSGNTNVMGALVGMVMKKTKGQANPKIVSELLRAKLSS
jgi:glutaminyl-tRNA synthetase